MDETNLKQRKKLIEKALANIVTIIDLSNVTQPEIVGESGVTVEHYANDIRCVGKKALSYMNKNQVKPAWDHIMLQVYMLCLHT